MTAEKAMRIAERFVEESNREAPPDVPGMEFVCLGARRSPDAPGEWSVLFDVRVGGHSVDGAIFVLVDDTTGDAKFLE